jgi:hypothetical protein
MNKVSKISLALVFGFLAGCATDTTSDSGLDAGSLATMRAGIWIDPNGCDHWIIDDGVEGYLTPRLRPDGTPVCRDEFDINNTIDFDRKVIGDS